MDQTLRQDAQLAEAVDDGIATYRAVSALAVIALLLGLASSLALVHPLLWIVPPLAVLAAFLALRAIAARPTELAGRNVALVGLAAALLFGGVAPARLVSRQARIYAEARHHADAWFVQVQEGKLYEAYELHLAAKDRQLGEVSLEKHYGDQATLTEPPKRQGPPPPVENDPRLAIRDFFSAPLMRRMVATGKEGEIIFLGSESQTYRQEVLADDVFLRYEFRYREHGKPRSAFLKVALTRTYDPKSRLGQWHLAYVTEADPSQPS